jgi:pyruvate/2-oxoglutarate dehydrogenase complex dihydrolipoamide acyltransferase (E2) component
MNPLRRKLAIASWGSPREANIYGKLTIDATAALRYIEEARATSGEKVTLTHLVGRAIAEALRRSPGLNGFIRLGTYQQRSSVDVTFLVALEEGGDLAKAKVANADQKSAVDIARELGNLAKRLRKGEDASFEKGKSIVRLLPTWILRPMLWLTGWVTGSLGLPFLGQERFPFGSCIITSVGMFGLDEGLVPPTPFARVPLYVLIGAVREQPVVVEGAVVIRPLLTLTATLDHRFVDGFQGGVMARTVREVLADPWLLDRSAPPGGGPAA